MKERGKGGREGEREGEGRERKRRYPAGQGGIGASSSRFSVISSGTTLL